MKRFIVSSLAAAIAVIGATGVAAAAEKVDLCRRTSSDSYKLINVSESSESAHRAQGSLAPGENIPGAPADDLLADDCSVLLEVTSASLNFGPNGWAGWSCPTGTEAVGGSHDLEDTTTEGIALPNSVHPHYTFGANESGYVVQNDNDSESGRTITVLCA